MGSGINNINPRAGKAGEGKIQTSYSIYMDTKKLKNMYASFNF